MKEAKHFLQKTNTWIKVLDTVFKSQVSQRLPVIVFKTSASHGFLLIIPICLFLCIFLSWWTWCNVKPKTIYGITVLCVNAYLVAYLVMFFIMSNSFEVFMTSIPICTKVWLFVKYLILLLLRNKDYWLKDKSFERLRRHLELNKKHFKVLITILDFRL